MPMTVSRVLSCIEHERLEFELIEVRTRGQCLMRLRSPSPEECGEWHQRERTAQANLVVHDLEHGCSR